MYYSVIIKVTTILGCFIFPRKMYKVMFFMMHSVCGQHYGDIFEYLYSQRVGANEPYYNETFFTSLENYQVNAKDASEDSYPWVARVVHSRTTDIPHVCTAACVEPKIFITAARCIFSLKVAYTTIINQNYRFPVIAFVFPSIESKQGFDEIGFLVVNDEGFRGEWATVALFDTTNRTDLTFDWFADLDLTDESYDHIVVGYAMQKGIHTKKVANRQFNLTKLEVIVNLNICPKMLIRNNLIIGFKVPCYHSCSVSQFEKRGPKCSNYHGAEGSVILNKKTNKVLGIATWGPYFNDYELPVGFSVPNSEAFFQDYGCARRIKEDNNISVTESYYQALCDNINKKIT